MTQQSSFFHVAVINESSVLSDNEVQNVIPGLQAQVSEDFAPVWGINATLSFVPKGNDPLPDNAWWLVILDNSDVADALGYHDLTNQGLPLGKVFAGTDMSLGLKWTVTASHELLEMLADPNINLAATVENEEEAIVQLYAYEVGDPCESDNDAYKKGGIDVSDFVYPSWFESFWKPHSAQFDYQDRIIRPFQLLDGGYALVFDVGKDVGWHQVFPSRQAMSYDMRPRKGSRRERRKTLRRNWLRSNVQPSSIGKRASAELRSLLPGAK